MYGTPITPRLAQPGKEFNMVISQGQSPLRPGGFGTFDGIPNQQFVRDQRAIRTDWKDDVSLVQRYRIPESVIGPQTEPDWIPVGPPKEIPKWEKNKV
ncbi:hypothetical protein ACFWWA_35390 [Streptomyces goshikiensis]|uniref:hypothetical protein n=1 Tax=Streptomyces goshikiensis TaxID=1942 RepID=UPI00366529A6